MDWARAIDRNREALIAIVAALFAMLGLDGEDTLPRMSRGLHRAALRMLRPAESATRRLIVIAARGLVVTPAPAARPKLTRVIAKTSAPRQHAPRINFQLYDPRKRFVRRRRPVPRVHVIAFDPRVSAVWALSRPVAPAAPPPEDDGLISGLPLCRRLHALRAALGDVPRQAKRLIRWRARRARDWALRPIFTSPLRPGPPPGHRRKPVYEVDEVLTECHWLAWEVLRLDTF
jgi:hypothetical protein